MHISFVNCPSFPTDQLVRLELDPESISRSPEYPTPDVINGLLNSGSDILVAKLDELPLAQNEDTWNIAAILPRTSQNLQVTSSIWDEDALFWLPRAIDVYAPSESTWQQIAGQRPDLERQPVENRATARILNDDDNESFQGESRKIHIKELVPPAGSHVKALICKKVNISLRKKLMQVHDQETAVLTNIERGIKKSLERSDILTAAFCIKDKHGRYHLASVGIKAGHLKHHFSIQSSWAGLAEGAITALEESLGGID